MKFAGLDLSLTSAGVSWHDTVTGETHVRTFKTKATSELLGARWDRISGQATDIIRWLPLDLDHAAIEAPAYAAKFGRPHERSGLWWEVVRQLLELGIHVTEVETQHVKRIALGKGSGAKDEVLAAMVRRFPDVPISGNDEADSVALLELLTRHGNGGVGIGPSLPASHVSSLDTIRWAW